MREYDRNGKFIRVIDPRFYDTEARKEHLYPDFIYVCDCNRDYTYKFSDSLRFIPCHHGYKHADGCEFNILYQDRMKRADDTVALKKDDHGNLSARLHENILKRPNRTDKWVVEKRQRFYDPNEPKVSVAHYPTFIRMVNLEASCNQAYFKDPLPPKDEVSFARYVYNVAKKCTVSNRGIMLNPNLDKGLLKDMESNGLSFFYCTVTDIKGYIYVDNKKKDISLIDDGLSAFREVLDKYTTIYTLRIETPGKSDDEPIRINVTLESLKKALDHYCSFYGVKSGKGHHIVASGYIYPVPEKNGIFYKADRCYLFRTCSHGIYVESGYEAAAFDTIFEAIADDTLAGFYKPYRFTKNAYGLFNYIEDGVLIRKGSSKRAVLEVFGRDDEKYKRVTALKESYANDADYYFIPWYPVKGEGTDVLKERVRKALYEIRGQS